ncbi:MAG TPA: 3',5'-cyclic-nucleotide phosphodiesterase [Limnobacter sp.]|nr:3',5'-cyclic-nucleotide phosphodiesterase [Limnobacter sp.]
MPLIENTLSASLEVLGCSGSMGSPGNGTSCYLLNDHVLIDAGLGMNQLATPALARIDAVFLTHSHLDHVCCLPFLVEARQHFCDSPLKVYGLPTTIASIQAHLFNDVIWPDFTRIPSADKPALEFVSFNAAVPLQISGITITAIEMNHSVPTLGYVLSSGNQRLALASDTYVCSSLGKTLSDFGCIDHLVIETSFANKHDALSRLSMHLCPSLLEEQLKTLAGVKNVWVSYLKEWERLEIEKEIELLVSEFSLKMLKAGQVIRF